MVRYVGMDVRYEFAQPAAVEDAWCGMGGSWSPKRRCSGGLMISAWMMSFALEATGNSDAIAIC
jgi:hypothetical protein